MVSQNVSEHWRARGSRNHRLPPPRFGEQLTRLSPTSGFARGWPCITGRTAREPGNFRIRRMWDSETAPAFHNIFGPLDDNRTAMGPPRPGYTRRDTARQEHCCPADCTQTSARTRYGWRFHDIYRYRIVMASGLECS